jgi:hypothetical protein
MCSPTDNICTQEDFMFLMLALTAEPQQPQKRRVRFASIVTATTAGPLPKEELKDLWYNQTDLTSFKYQARELVRLPTAVDVCRRGLEHCTPQRKKHRYMTICCTLSAHRRGMSADQTAMVARKCAQWCEEIAFVQACHDYATIYQPNLRSLIPAVHSSPPEFPFLLKQKKRSDCTASAGQCSRRVRSRVSLH